MSIGIDNLPLRETTMPFHPCALGNGGQTRIPYLRLCSVHSSGGIFNSQVLARLSPTPGSLSVLASLLVSITAFEVSFVKLDYATNMAAGQPSEKTTFLDKDDEN